MPKKPTSNRLDKLFKGMRDETAKPSTPALPKNTGTGVTGGAREKSARKTPARPVEKKPAVSVSHTAPAKPAPRASALAQTEALPPLEAISIARRGAAGTPSSMSLAFQMDSLNWATLQVVDETAERNWDQNEQLLVRQVTDQLSQALENARLFQETRSRAEELAVLNEMGRELAGLLSIESIAEAVYKYASRLMDTTNLFVSLFDETKQEITPIFVINNRERVQVPPRKLGMGLTDHILRTHEPLFIPDDMASHMKNLGLEAITLGNNRLAQCWLGAPLIAGNSILGIIAVQSVDAPNLFNEHHRDLLTAISSQAAIAIQNARLFEETQTRTRELDTLNELNQRLSAQLDVNQVLQEIYSGVTRLIDAKNFYIGLYSPEKNEVSFPYNVTESVIDQKITTLRANQGMTGHILRTRKPLLLQDNVVEAMQEMGIESVGEPAKCWLGVPLLLGEQVIGIMAAQSYTEPNAYDEHDRDLLMAVAGQAAISIQNTRLFGETQRSEAELRALFTAMTDVIIVYDNNGRYMRIAPTNPSHLFQPPDNMLGKTIPEVLPTEIAQTLMAAIQQALDATQGDTIHVEYPLVVNENEYWFDGSVSKLSETEVFLVARDITDRKRNEEALRRRNEYLSATAEIGQLVTSTMDMPTLFSRTVNLVRDRFGFYHAGIFITEETGFNAILQAATGEAGAEMLHRKHSLPVGSKSIVGEVTESGRAVVVNDTAASKSHKFNPLLPETRAEAAIPLHVGSRTIGALDIQSTSPNAFSEDDIAVLQTLADQIAIAIDNARSYELSMQAVKEMREADRLKSQFLANMSHELRTPLNSIIGFSRVILKGIDGPTTDLQQQDLLAIHNSGQHLLGLINDILDLSRIEAGKMELTFDEVNLTELIASVMSTVTGLIKDKSITLHRDLPANLPTVRADAMRIRQVLLNLLANAAKFTDEGSITVHASVKDNSSGHPEITISVTDTGPGIAQEDQKKLFQPFSQVDASPTRKSGGSGLGLSISNHLIQMHGGHIGVESTPAQGSVFFFTLPAFRGKSDRATSPANRIILAIDDDPQVISLYERYLQPQGYQVISLSDPSRAVERVRQLKPFAVTLDIMMPGYDGWRVLNDLKSNPETRNIPVIVCSIVEEQEKGFDLGAADYLVKPIFEDDLLNVLDRLNIDGSIREVLIVDDDPNDLRLIGRMLSENGRYRPILAEGGRNGWEAIQARTPHAVIIDLFMPEMDGFAILEKMQSEDKLRDIPVIVVSGGDLTTEQKQMLQDFGHRMIQKSALNENQLLTTLERALKRAKQ
jgi:PAS domain S-box-containing protein